MSNFNEEIEKELAKLNLGGKLVPIAEEEKGTIEDYTKLETGIFLKTEENRKIMEQSLINAEKGLPIGAKYPNLTQTSHNHLAIQLKPNSPEFYLNEKYFSLDTSSKEQIEESLINYSEESPQKIQYNQELVKKLIKK